MNNDLQLKRFLRKSLEESKAMLYRDIVSINKNFQASINLEFDLNNEKKIEEYIPTSDICDVLKRYFRCFLGMTTEKATTLVGPYGKGKSFLLLVLSYLIGKDKKTIVYKNLLKRIKAIDKELYDLIMKFDAGKMKLLPVIVNSNYDNVQQSFMLALNDALKRVGKESIVPNTIYSVCLELLENWRKNKGTWDTLKVCLERERTTYKELKLGLEDYSPEKYRTFENIYNCMTIGVKFNPLISDDVTKLYSDVDYELSKLGYSGMFIIFDEFSKFIESSGSSLMKNLKIIQDFAELASRSSKDCQLHITCVTHKSLNLYIDSSNKKDSFKTVEGRFTEIKFNRSLEENYQIISAAIRKKAGYEKVLGGFKKKNAGFIEGIQKSQPFEKEGNVDSLINGCFPLNPMTVYALIHLSEIVAQNERTLFTFISDTDEHSLNSFIRNSNTTSKLFDVDEIYDYFSPLLRREEENAIRNIWFRTEGTLARTDDQKKRKLIKALAIILMINDNDRFAPSVENLSLAVEMPEEETQNLIDAMIGDHYLRRNVINHLLSFASANSKEIDDQIKTITKARGKNIPIDSIAGEIDETKYFLPRRHNEQKKITRFLRTVYLTEKQFMEISSFDVFYEHMFCDGIVINLIRSDLKEKDIKSKMLQINDQRAIVRYPAEKMDKYFTDELIRYAAIQEIIRRGGNDQVVTSELNILFEEIRDDIQSLIDRHYGKKCKFFSAALKNEDTNKDFIEALSLIMERYYPKTPVFNNELINKNVLTTQYQKPVNNVMQWILDGMNETDYAYTETSPESTVRASVVNRILKDSTTIDENAREIVDGIKDFIFQAERKKAEMQTIVDKYTAAPYGVRKGILPILFSKAISELSDNVILYIQNQELDLIPANIVKAINNPGKYSVSFSRGSKEQSNYLYNMLALLKAKTAGNFRVDTKTLCEEYRKFFVGLPAIMRARDNLSDYLKIDQNIIAYQNLFYSYNINPYELVFDRPQEIFETSDYGKITNKLSDYILNWKEYLNEYKQELIGMIRKEFSIRKTTSLKMGLTDYIRKVTEDTTPVLNEEASRINNAINNSGFDDSNTCDDLAYATIGVYIEDWNNDESETMKEKLHSFKNALIQSNRIDTSNSSLDQILSNISSVQSTPLGQLMRNSIENAMDEFAEGVSTEEKIAILGELMKSLL